MATEVKLPQLGQTMEEGTIVSCLAKVGDEIKRGDVIFEIETDKATLEMESPADGFVKQVIAQPGRTLPVGETLMVLGAKEEQVKAPVTTDSAKPAAITKPAQTATSSAGATPPASANVVKLPQLGQTMEEGTIVNCLIKVGDKVQRGDVIFEVETDKATLEMESPGDGFVKCVLAEQGQVIPVGEAVLILADKDADISQQFIDSLKGAAPAAVSTAQMPQQKDAAKPTTTATPLPQKTTAKVVASPRAKKLAKEKGVDLAAVTGTGPGGRITEKDILAAAEAKSAGKAPAAAEPEYKLGQVVPMNRLQKITAQKMLKSKQEIPCFYLTVKADVTDLVEYRTKINQAGGVKVAYNDFIIRAVAMGLEKFPMMTGQADGDSIKLADSIGIGLAMAVPGGLVAPIVKDADKKNVSQIASDSQALIQRARADKLSLDDLQGGCITVSNLGFYGIDAFIPIVVPGQCSIMGVGQITDTVVPDSGSTLVRKLMTMTLSIDHKVANGAYAAQFLDFARKLLENPESFK